MKETMDQPCLRTATDNLGSKKTITKKAQILLYSSRHPVSKLHHSKTIRSLQVKQFLRTNLLTIRFIRVNRLKVHQLLKSKRINQSTIRSRRGLQMNNRQRPEWTVKPLMVLQSQMTTKMRRMITQSKVLQDKMTTVKEKEKEKKTKRTHHSSLLMSTLVQPNNNESLCMRATRHKIQPLDSVKSMSSTKKLKRNYNSYWNSKSHPCSQKLKKEKNKTMNKKVMETD